MKLSYKHEPDITAGAYSAGDWRKPAGTETGKLTFSLTSSSLDDNGLYYFKQPSPNQQKNLLFVATEVKVVLNAGYLNFDFLGTFYDQDTAVTGIKDSRDDDWNTRYISDFWISEDNSEATISTNDESSAITNCLETCSASGTNSFAALRLTEFARYKCKCLDLSLSPLLIEVRELCLSKCSLITTPCFSQMITSGL